MPRVYGVLRHGAGLHVKWPKMLVILFCLVMQGGEGKAKKKRISLSLHVGRINSGLSASALSPGLALPAAVKSVEDHGYTLTFGIKARTRQ